jgi:hypothetical protein
MLWVGGDGHCAGAYAVNHCANCEDDSELWWKGRQPHPENAAVNWVTTLANTIKTQFINESDIRDTVNDIVLKCNRFILNNTKSQHIVIVGCNNPQDNQLLELSIFLKQNHTRHIFFNTKDYIDFSIQNRCKINNYGYFGKDAHQAWANVMVSQLRQLEII